MKKKSPKGPGSGPVESVNMLAPDYSILPVKIPQKPKEERGNQSESKLLQVRIIPGYYYDSQGTLKENAQLDPQALKDIQSIDEEDLLGDWVIKTPALSVSHYNFNTKETSYSWLPGEVLQDNGTGEYDEVRSPAVDAGWKWFMKLKDYRDRKKELWKDKKLDAKGVYNVLQNEFDMPSIRAVENVMPFDTMFIQVVPIALGADELPYQVYGKTLLPIQKRSVEKKLINVLTKVHDKCSGQDLSVETCKIGDVVSLEGGHVIGIKQEGTEAVITKEDHRPLSEDFIKPENDLWRPWDCEDQEENDKCVFPPQDNPQEIVNNLIKVTSPGAVAWALGDSQWQNLVPERYKEAGSSFCLEPISKASETIEGSPEVQEIKPQNYVNEDVSDNSGNDDSENDDSENDDSENDENPLRKTPTEDQKQETITPPPPITPEKIKPEEGTEVSEDSNSKYEEMEKKLREQHNSN